MPTLALDPYIALGGALVITFVGIVWTYFSRLPLIELPSKKESRCVNQGGGYRHSNSLTERHETRWEGVRAHLRIDRIAEQSHELVCTLVFRITADLIQSLRRVEPGTSNFEYPAVVTTSKDSPGQLIVDARNDPRLTVTFMLQDPDVLNWKLNFSWKLSELVEALGSESEGCVMRQIQIPTMFQTTSYPNDRYSTGFWLWLNAPNRHFFARPNGSATFAFEPTIVISCGPAMLHWDCRLANRVAGKTTDATCITLARQWTDAVTIYAIHFIPLALSILIAALLKFSPSEAQDERGIVLRAASVFLALISLRSVVPSPDRSFGRTRADVLLLTGIMVMVWLLVFALVASAQPPAPKYQRSNPPVDKQLDLQTESGIPPVSTPGEVGAPAKDPEWLRVNNPFSSAGAPTPATPGTPRPHCRPCSRTC